MTDDWREQAACRGRDVALFFPTDEDHDRSVQAQALQVCSTCPVAGDCLKDALATPGGQWGVRGGLTAPQRRRMKQARRRLTPARCGTDSGYHAHFRRGQNPCEECREAHNLATRRWRAQYDDERTG